MLYKLTMPLEVRSMGELYDTDVLEWSEHQARLLRQHAAGEAGNEAPDWANIIEEVESVGRDQLHAVESLLAQAMAHMLKADAWPLSREVPGWQAEARRFRDDAAARFSPSMRQRIDGAKLIAVHCACCPIQLTAGPSQGWGS